MKLAAVIIPIYKKKPSKQEIASIIQCYKVLNNYPIVLVCPNKLDVTEYLSTIKSNIIIERFNDEYFEGIKGYNKLMLSLNFYKRFKKFQYILIYQLDAWVFKDELTYWCQKGYDYIGAPWFEDFSELNTTMSSCGNGGFSLRKVNAAIKVLQSFKRIVPFKNILKTTLNIPYNWKGRIISFYDLFKTFIFLNNCTHHLFIDFKFNEDIFWAEVSPKRFSWYKIPNTIEALKFSFEKKPSFLYEKNNLTLPFGCHAWQKHEPDFWKKFIPDI